MDAKVQIKLKNENRKLKFDVIKHKKRAADESTALLFFPLGEIRGACYLTTLRPFKM
jgi:hypothetical protein